jgi:succinate dehydrogenase/fumarate reductase cytochrome b subunit
MTTQPALTPHVGDAAAGALPRSWQRLLALSGVVFAALFLAGWFTTGGLTPHYTEPNHEWINWARDNQWNGRISGFLMLLAGFVFLHFMGAIRSVLGNAESPARGSAQLARVAFGGAVTGMAGIATASVMLAAAGSNGADVDPVVSKAVATASGGPFLVAAMGFAAFLMAAGLLTLRTGVFARWTGIVALLGAVCFLLKSERERLRIERRRTQRDLRVLKQRRNAASVANCAALARPSKSVRAAPGAKRANDSE